VSREEQVKPVILIVDDEEDMRWLLSNILRAEGFAVEQAADGQKTLEYLRGKLPDLILLDLKMPGMDGLEVLRYIKEQNLPTPVIMLTAHGDIPSSVKAMKLGAYDFLTKPFDNNQLVFTIRRALEHYLLQKEVSTLREQIRDRNSLFFLMGTSRKIQQLSYQVDQVAKTNFTVIIEGETGTGKELMAHFIHSRSLRREGPFVPVDCSAIPDTLIESELFGYERGAFTGAVQSKPGLFEVARGGTLFLDEVANIPHNIQKKLLRVLQERQFYHLGGSRPIEADVRIIAASNVSLEEEVRKGNLRRDLYHRLNEFTIYLPPLRERREDILFLAKKFLDETSYELGKKLHGFSPEAVEALLNYDWKGNVRELRNVIRRAVLLSPDIIHPHHLFQSPAGTATGMEEKKTATSLGLGEKSLREIAQAAMEEAERRAIAQALKDSGGNKAQAAKLLQVDYKTLYRKLKKYAPEKA